MGEGEGPLRPVKAAAWPCWLPWPALCARGGGRSGSRNPCLLDVLWGPLHAGRSPRCSPDGPLMMRCRATPTTAPPAPASSWWSPRAQMAA